MRTALRSFVNLRTLRGWIGLVFILGTIVLAASTLRAGPLSDVEVARLLNGIPTRTQAVTCSTGQATAATALPTNSLVRIAVEGTVGINYSFGATGDTLAVNGGPYLPPSAVEYVQNGAATRFFCIQRSGSSTPTVSIMR